MLLAACSEKAPQPDTADLPKDSPAVSEDQPIEPPVENTTPEPDEELRYDVKEVLLYGQSWGLSYPENAVNLSNAQINGLLDRLSTLEFPEEDDGNGYAVIGGSPVVCTIVTDDNRYCLDFNNNTITLWQTDDELFTIEGRKHWKIYSFSDDPIFDYVMELHNAVKPDGIEPIF